MQTQQLPVNVVEVSPIRRSEANNNPFFTVTFKKGLFGDAIQRTFWGVDVGEGDEATIRWKVLTHEAANALVGQNVGAEVDVLKVDVEPYETPFTNPETKKPYVADKGTVVVFHAHGESISQAIRRYGWTPKGETSDDSETPDPIVTKDGEKVASEAPKGDKIEV